MLVALTLGSAARVEAESATEYLIECRGTVQPAAGPTADYWIPRQVYMPGFRATVDEDRHWIQRRENYLIVDLVDDWDSHRQRVYRPEVVRNFYIGNVYRNDQVELSQGRYPLVVTVSLAASDRGEVYGMLRFGPEYLVHTERSIQARLECIKRPL